MLSIKHGQKYEYFHSEKTVEQKLNTFNTMILTVNKQFELLQKRF